MSVGPFVPIGMGALLLVSAFFSASETALFSLEKVEIERRTARGGIFGESLRWCVDNARTILVTILLSNLAANTLYFALAGYWAREAGGYVATAVTIGALVALVFVAEILPKSIALGLSGPLAATVAPALRSWAILLTPFRLPLGFVLDFLGHRVAAEPAIPRSLTHDELEEMVKQRPERFGLGKRSANVVGELVGLSGLQIREVMVPFVDLELYEQDLSVEEALEIVLEKRWRWLLVDRRGGPADQRIAYVDVRDLLVADRASSIGDHARDLAIIPELARLPHLLELLKNPEINRFLVVDEYGNDAGVVGREDVTESIVGGFARAEHEETELPIRFRPERGWELPGGMGIHEFESLFSLDLPIARNRTIGGLIVEQLDRIPSSGDRVTIAGRVFEVLGASRGRVHTVLVHFDEVREPSAAEAAKGDAEGGERARNEGAGK